MVAKGFACTQCDAMRIHSMTTELLPKARKRITLTRLTCGHEFVVDTEAWLRPDEVVEGVRRPADACEAHRLNVLRIWALDHV